MNKILHIDKKVHYTLRFAAALCFIGHGAFGIITKQIWVNYFAVFGINEHLAYQLMPVVGVADILMGISLLFYPTRAILLWLAVWGAVTALLRPLSGEYFAEAVERAGNYGTPIVLLILSGYKNDSINGWFNNISNATLINELTVAKAVTCLKVVVFMLLVGHGWLNLLEKQGLLNQYASLGFSNPALVAHIAGVFEILAGISILLKPIRPVLAVLLVWKISSELFYPHWEAFEWIERAGSYGTILTLWLLLPAHKDFFKVYPKLNEVQQQG